MNNVDDFQIITRSLCPGCGSRSISILRRFELSDAKLSNFLIEYYERRLPLERLGDWAYVVACCDDCKLLFQQQILAEPGLEFLYEKAIDSASSLAKRENGDANSFLNRLRTASQVFWFYPNDKPRNLRVLDFGMGWGHWCIAATALGLDAYGAELSEDRIAFAKSLGIRVLTDLESREGKFHFINTEQSLEHVVNLSATLATLSNLLHPGGVLRVSVPDGSRMLRTVTSARWKPSKDALHPLEHVNAFSYESAASALAKAGLQPVQLRHLHGRKATLAFLRKHVTRRTNPNWFFIK